MINKSMLMQKLFSEKSVALFMHMRPDGDTIGSTLALYNALKQKGIPVGVYCSDAIPNKFSYLQSIKFVNNVINDEYSAMVSVDCADVTRLGEFANVFASHKNTYNIDHHISNTKYADSNYVTPNASNCENVYELLQETDVGLDQEIANLLLTGIVTDTGNFAHSNVTPKTFEIAGKLLSCGADLNKIVYHNFKAQTKERAKLHGMVTSKIRYFLEDRFGVITITQDDFVKSGATQDQTEGFIDFLMGVNSVEVGACVMEIAKEKYKISFRSKGADVNAVAGTFGGGGHTLASGCQINGLYEEVIDKIVFAVSKYLQD